MRPFSTGELGRLKNTQQGAMQDTCGLYTLSVSSTDDFNQPVRTYVLAATVDCGVELAAAAEVMGETQVPEYDAKIRLPVAQFSVIENVDRITVTHRYGIELDIAWEFEIIGPPRLGPSGVVVECKLVTT